MIGTGSGCSAFENANTWQASIADWRQTQRSTYRGVAYVSTDADRYTGAAIYDSTSVEVQSGWFLAAMP